MNYLCQEKQQRLKLVHNKGVMEFKKEQTLRTHIQVDYNKVAQFYQIFLYLFFFFFTLCQFLQASVLYSYLVFKSMLNIKVNTNEKYVHN